MKKVLLLLLATATVGAIKAQDNAPAKIKLMHFSTVKLAEMRAASSEKHATSGSTTKNTNRRPGRIGNPNLPFLGSTANVFGVFDATTSAVTANQACNLIVMTKRDNNTNVGNCGTGAYIGAFSTDNGSTWDTTSTLMFCNPDPLAGARYPNGALFNPAGNTNPNNVFDVMAGPWTNGTGTGVDGWTQTVYGSISIGGGNASKGMYWANGAAGVVTQNTGDLSFMSSSDDSTVHLIGEGYNENPGKTAFTAWLGAVLTTGKFNAATDSFDWTQTVFRPHLVPNIQGFQNMSLPYDSDAGPSGVPGTAWSQDGKTGYVVLFCNLDSSGVGFNYNFGSDQPIVYKTTDAGAHWAMMTPYNFRNIPSLTRYLKPTSDSNIQTPMWYVFDVGAQGAVDGYDLTVDVNGNLHILGAVTGAGLSTPDSAYIGSYWSQQGYIYDVYTTSPSGGWQARLIDSMMTHPCVSVSSNYSTDWYSSPQNNVAFGARIQASRTTDGKKVFCTWVDDNSGIQDSLVSPDVYSEGYNVITNTAGPVHQMTSTGTNYFLCVSDIALTSGSPDTTYTIPCTIVFPDPDPSDGSTPVNYYYLGSVVFNDTLNSTTSVPTVASKGFSVGPNYPNPFTGATQFNLSLANESTVSVEVFNIFGQKVYSINTQVMQGGNHLITINGSGLNSGVYFYRVTVNNQSVTQKMVVQ